MRYVYLLVFLPSVLFSYTPGKWSHMDEFIFQGKLGGPIKEVVKDANGKLIYTATYTYNQSGQLIKEVYTNDKGMPDGSTTFIYDKGRVESETLFDAAGLQKEKKVFKYNGSKLDKIVLYNQEKSPELVCTIHSFLDGMVGSAETKWSTTEDSEKFVITPDEKNSQIWKQTIYNSQNESVGTVVYYFDKKRNLIRRENVQQGQERKNELFYNASGQLEKSSFHVKRDKNWVLVKTHYLYYDQTKKTLVN